MKKLFILALPLLLASCGGSDKTQATLSDRTPLEEYTATLITLYPNYQSNEMAQRSIADSIASHARAQIGKIPTDLTGMKFHFAELKEGRDTCVVTFYADGYASIGHEVGNKHNLTATPGIVVIGKVDNSTAATLDHNAEYSISGEMFAWDATPWHHSMLPDINFGTYFLDVISVTEIKKP